MYRNYHKRYSKYKKLWSLKRYCSDGIEHIENYFEALADGFDRWCIHHRLEFTMEGDLAHTSSSLKRLGMYYNRPSFEPVFMRVADHRSMHNGDTIKRGMLFKGTTGHLGHKHTEEAKQKMRDAKKRAKGVRCV